MAATGLTQIAALMALSFSGSEIAARQFRGAYTALRIIPKADPALAVGDQCTWPVYFRRVAGGPFKDQGVDFGTAEDTPKDSANLAWSEWGETVEVHDIARGLARQSAYAQRGSLMTSEQRDVADSVYAGLNTAVYSGDPGAGTPELAGLVNAMTGATYAGVNSATAGQGEWVGNVPTVLTATFAANPAKELRNGLLNPIRDKGGNPSVVLCNSSLVSLFLDDQKAADASTRIIGTNGMTLMDIGARGVFVDGVLVIDDPDAPANTFATWDLRHVRMITVPQAEMMDEDDIIDMATMAQAMTEILGRQVDESAVAGLLGGPRALPPLYTVPLGRTGTRKSIGVAGQGQIQYLRRNVHGTLTLT